MAHSMAHSTARQAASSRAGLQPACRAPVLRRALALPHVAPSQPQPQQEQQPADPIRQLFARVCAWRAAIQLPAPGSPEDLRTQMASAGRCCMAAIAPFASTLVATNSSGDIYFALSKAIDIYMMLLTVRVLVTWFNVNWISEPFRTLRQFTDPPLNACRGLLPPVGGIDLSPMLLFFGLSFLSKALRRLAMGV